MDGIVPSVDGASVAHAKVKERTSKWYGRERGYAVDNEGWNELARLNWPNFIAAAAKDITFHIASANDESWLFPERLQGEMSSVKGASQIRAYIYARNALIELHKRVADVVETDGTALPAIRLAVQPYKALEVALRANVVRPAAFARNVRQFVQDEPPPDKWAAVAAYQRALEAAAIDLLQRKDARAVMQLGSVDD